MAAKIIRIIDSDTLIADISQYDTEVGDEYKVYDPKESEIIEDPSTKKILGKLPIPKGILIVDQTYGNFSTLKIKSDILDPINYLGSSFYTDASINNVQREGRVEKSQIKPIKSKSNTTIKVGDSLLRA